jgi:hypothetical protein
MPEKLKDTYSLGGSALTHFQKKYAKTPATPTTIHQVTKGLKSEGVVSASVTFRINPMVITSSLITCRPRKGPGHDTLKRFGVKGV